MCASVPLGSCGLEARSCDLATNAIVLRATVTDSDEDLEVELELETGGSEEGPGTALELCSDSGEVLRVNGEDAKPVRVLGQLYYTVELDERAELYTIEFVREAETIRVDLELPPPFSIVAPVEDQEVPRGETFDITWEPDWPGHMISLAIEDEIGSDCLEGLGFTQDIEDLGASTLAANKLEAGTAAAETCKAWVSLTRSASAAYPSELHEGGSIEGFVKRRRRFLSSY